ncbi:hypothetical protein AV530_008722 [Patagioenas fasciata monilis]|uniref:PDZ domain-containing protein n=1 Tax=Patagioenas fasciata monilis TaxID=372326 RepID=A0A1V4L227_PATFA|nr:hypothetical protein AV530_008722 [Patagioenas fasciata monilis]
MPITQDNAGVFLPLLCQWLQNSRREGDEGAEQRLCRSAVQKLSEYIQLTFSVDESKLQPGSCGTSDTEICTMYLAQEMRKTEVLGLSFGNIPALGDYGEKRRGGKKRKGHKGPVLDVGCIWVTDLKKNSPAGKCGRVRLKDEILSLNGQLMVGVDVTGASYLAEQCWNGGFVYLIMLRRIKRKAPLPPSNGNNSNSCDPKAKPSPEPGDRAAQNGKRTRKFGVITRTPGSKDSKEKPGSEHGNGHCTPMEVEVAQPETSEAESNGEEQLRGTGGQYQCRLSDGGIPDIGDQSAQGVETEKSQDSPCAEVSKGNNQSPALGSGILKYRSRSQGAASRLESVGEDDELTVENGESSYEIAVKYSRGGRKHSLPQQLESAGARQDYHIVKKSTRSFSAAQVESPWRLTQPSIISNIVLMKGQGKQGSVSSEAELSQYFSHDSMTQLPFSDTVTSSSDEEQLRQRNRNSLLDDGSLLPGNLTTREAGMAKANGLASPASGRSSSPHNKHVESVRPGILSDSPKSTRSPFHRQRRVVFYDGDVSDDDESSHSQRSQRAKSQEDTGIVVSTSSVEIDDESQDSESPRYSGTETSSPVFTNSVESADSTLGQSDSPFFPIIAFDYSSVPEVRLGSLSLRELREAQLESKRSPKLEHRAVTRVKSMMSTECRSLQRQRTEEHGSYNKPVARTLPHSKKCEAPDQAGQSQGEIVTLVRNEHESFGLDLEIQAMPLKVVVTGLRPGGPAEMGSMGKMAVGDEITTINSIPVSKMTYEEICLLMQCLPTSVTLEIQKASSAVSRYTNLILSPGIDSQNQADVNSILTTEEERSAGKQEGVGLQSASGGCTVERTTLPPDATSKGVQKGTVKSSRAEDCAAIPITDIDDLLSQMGAPENRASRTPSRVESPLRDGYTTMCCCGTDEGCPSSEPQPAKEELLEKTRNCEANAQGVLGLSVLDSINTGKLFTVNKNSLSNYSRNFSSLNEDEFPAANSLQGKRSDAFPKSMYGAAEDSHSDTESVTENFDSANEVLPGPCTAANASASCTVMESDEEQIEICCVSNEPQKPTEEQHLTSATSSSSLSLLHPSGSKVSQTEGCAMCGSLETSINNLGLEDHSGPTPCPSQCLDVSSAALCTPSSVFLPEKDILANSVRIAEVYSSCNNGALITEDHMDAGNSDGHMKCCESFEEEGSLHCKKISFCSAGNVNGLENDLLEKEGCHDEQRSKSESETAVDDCSHAVSYCLVKRETNSLSNLSKTDSNHVNASSPRAISLRSPFPTRSKDPKANSTHDLPGKNEKINSVTSGRTSNGKVQSSGTNHCKGAAVPHNPSLQKKSCQESKGIAQKSIMDTLLNNQKTKAGPKLKGFTIKSKAKANSDSSGINPTKVSGADQKRISVSPQLSPKLLGKKTPLSNNSPTSSDPGKSLSAASRPLKSELENKPLVISGDSLLPLLNGTGSPTVSGEMKRGCEELTDLQQAWGKPKEKQVSMQPMVCQGKGAKLDDFRAKNGQFKVTSSPQGIQKVEYVKGRTENPGTGLNMIKNIYSADDLKQLHLQNVGPSAGGSSSLRSPSVHQEQVEGQEIQRTFIEEQATASRSTQRIHDTSPSAGDIGYPVTDRLRIFKRNYFYYELNWPHEPTSSFSVKQRIKSFENLANFDRPIVKAIDTHSAMRSPLSRRSCGAMATAANPAETPRALRRSLSSYGGSLSPATVMAKAHTSAEPTPVAEGSKGEGKPQRSEEGSTGADAAAFPPSASQTRRSRGLGRPPLSRSRLRELRALSMPDLDKLCAEGFSGPPPPVCFKTELEITPRRALGLPARSNTALSSHGGPAEVGTRGTCASSPRDSGSGTPGSASDDDVPHDSSSDGECSEKSWSISLDQLLISSLDQQKLQSVLSAVVPKCDVAAMLQEVKTQVKSKEDTYFVVLHKEEGAGVGFSVAGGTDLEQKSVTVHRVFSKGVASQEGTIHRGDLVLSINGKSLASSVHGDVLNTLHQARLYKCAVIVIQKEKDKANNFSRLEISATGKKCVRSGKEVSMAIGTDPNLDMNDVICVELLKTSAGLGFSLDGGKASIAGDRPLLVKRIFKGGAAEQSGNIETGDEILANSAMAASYKNCQQVLQQLEVLLAQCEVLRREIRNFEEEVEEEEAWMLCVLFVILELAVLFFLAAAVLYASCCNAELLYHLLLQVLREETYYNVTYAVGKILTVVNRQGLVFCFDVAVLLQEGDEILEVNGESLQGLTHQEAIQRFKQLKKGVVTLTVRTRLRSPSLTPSAAPTLLSRSSSPSSSASGGTPVTGPDEADSSVSSRKGPGPKDRIVMDVTLNKEPGVGLGIGACCLTLENSSPGIYIHSLAPGSVAKMDGRLRRKKATGDLSVV